MRVHEDREHVRGAEAAERETLPYFSRNKLSASFPADVFRSTFQPVANADRTLAPGPNQPTHAALQQLHGGPALTVDC